MHDNDQAMREYAATLPLPEFENPAFTTPPPLWEARVVKAVFSNCGTKTI